ncbi:MAG: hypothetical protein VYB57_05700 [Cyanobacteriota bacterium]|nr:hypothetical protein [Cyanobacteriota bacterium]
MTNFQAQPPSRFAVTPERLVLALPALAGGLLAAGLALAWLLPAWQRNGALEQQRQLLKSQGEALAANRARLGRSREGLQQAEADQRKLLQIVAGTDQLDTLLAQLAVEAAAAGVTLESYEPQAAPAPAPNSKRSKAKGNEAPPSDPLLVDGELVKREQLVMASGAFPQLLVFLRRIESLSPLAVLRDLNLSHPAPSGDGEDSAEPTVLKFNLSVYSRAPKEDQAPSTSGRKEPAA